MKQLRFLIFVFLIAGGILISAQNTKAQTGYMSSYLEVFDTTVIAESETTLYNYNFVYYYQVGVEGRLFNQSNIQLAYDSQQRTNPSAHVTTRVYGATRGQNYKLISTHTAYAQYVRYSEEQQLFLYQDRAGLTETGGGEYSSPHELQTSQQREIVTDTIDLGRTSVTLQVPLGAPQLTSIDDTNGIPNRNIATTLRGANLFGSNQSVYVSGSGDVTARVLPDQLPNNIEVLNIEIQIAANAAFGDRQISLTVNGQTSNSLTFRVGDRSPVITRINPSEGAAGQSVPVTITGTNFGTSPDIDITGGGISEITTNATGTEIQAVFTVDPSAQAGSRSVAVISSGISGMGFQSTTGESATSNSVGFQVTTTNSTVQFSSLPVVEKNGERILRVTVRNLVNSSDTTRLTFKTALGTFGAAKFIDASGNEVNELVINGEVENQAVTIKGITESSQANNMTVEARIGNATVVKAARVFTVATITSLVFERFDGSYVNLDPNPGNGQTGSAVGKRIFPDKNDVATVDTKDRSLVKVIATVSPTLLNVQVYFGSYDLDDPSAVGLPIDTTGSDGNDNNGVVNFSKAGAFIVQSGINCSAANPPVTSQIGCSIASDGTATAAFKTTMQPGDNFAIAASLTDTYRDAITLNSNDGSKLIGAANKTIPISGSPNTDNVPAIRTEILTVWRKLHIEADSMGNVSGNSVTGQITTGVRNSSSSKITLTLSVSTLEPNRFENGRLVIGTNSYRVIPYDVTATPLVNANIDHSVTISNPGTFSVRINDPFTLYDDDDFNNDDAMNLDGDMLPVPGEDIVENSDIKSWVQNSDDLQLNRFAVAYIRPDYDWAIQNGFNDTNATFNLNVPDSPTAIAQTVNEKRNSSNLESDNFWVAYLLFSYQGSVIEDFDPLTDDATGGAGTASLLTDDSVAGGSAAPPGSVGSLIFLETGHDFDDLLYDENTPVRKVIVPHEIGHQFGLKGDDENNEEIFGMMNPYGLDGGTVFNPQFVPRHINVMRRRISSPGK